MSDKSLFDRLLGWLPGTKKKPGTQAEPDEADKPAGKNGETTASASPEAPPKKTQVQLLQEALEHQASQLQAVLDELRGLDGANERLLEAVQSTASPDAPAGKSIAELTERSEELAGELRDLSAAGERQLELLRKIQDSLEARKESDLRTAGLTARVSEFVEHLSRSNASQVELMEQIRDRLAGGDEELSDLLARQGKRLRRLLWVILAVLGLILILVAWGAIF